MVEQGQVRDVGSADVNAYIRAVAGAESSAKDFRTWNGTVLVAEALARAGPFTSKLRAALHEVAEKLGNTVTVCRASYVHPAIIEGYLAATPCAVPEEGDAKPGDLSAAERAVLRYLEDQARKGC